METLLLINLIPQTWGIILLLTGIALQLFIGMRRFNRRGMGGLQHYPNYFLAVIISCLEWACAKTALLLIILGIFMIIPWHQL